MTHRKGVVLEVYHILYIKAKEIEKVKVKKCFTKHDTNLKNKQTK